MKKLFKINGEIIETKMIKTLKAAENFISKKENREMVFFRSHEYFVTI